MLTITFHDVLVVYAIVATLVIAFILFRAFYLRKKYIPIDELDEITDEKRRYTSTFDEIEVFGK